MWVIAKHGFVSLVEHNTDPDLIRARARRREHLADTFDLNDIDIIDLGRDAPDYRWHADVPRVHVAQALYDAVLNLDYSSHVKEEVSGADNVMYSSMLGCWRELYKLQDPPGEVDTDWWWDEQQQPSRLIPRLLPHGDGTFEVLDNISDQIVSLADKMLESGRTRTAEPTAVGLPVRTWAGDAAKCILCEDDLNTGDRYVVVPESFLDEAGPAHEDCAFADGW